MKLKTIATIAFLISFTSSVFAQYFPATAYVQVLPGRVTAQVYNPYYEPIICNGQVFGQTYSGMVYNTFFYQQFMPAGSYRYAFVQTLPHDPFANGWSNIQCHFARWF